MPRNKPISIDIIEAQSLKELNPLYIELEGLLSKLLNLDKRALRSGFDKELYKSKLNLYCRLYKQIRDKFVKLTKEEGRSSFYKIPLTFDEYIMKWKKEKYVNYSGSDDEDEEEADAIDTITDMIDSITTEKETKIDLHQEINKIFQNIMTQKYFNRQDPGTIESAIKDTIIAFLEKHKGQTSEEILQKAYHEIKAKNTKPTKPVQTARVGDEKTDEVLSAVSPVTGGKVEELLETVTAPIQSNRWENAPVIQPTVQALPQEEISEMLQDEHEHPGGTVIVEVREEFPANVEGSKEFNETNSTDEKPVFKTLPLETKLQLIREQLEKLGAGTKTGPIKKALEANYTIGHYDDVYNMLIKLK